MTGFRHRLTTLSENAKSADLMRHPTRGIGCWGRRCHHLRRSQYLEAIGGFQSAFVDVAVVRALSPQAYFSFTSSRLLAAEIRGSS